METLPRPAFLHADAGRKFPQQHPDRTEARSCSRMYFAIVASLRPTVETQWPSAQNLLLPNSCLRFACRSSMRSELFPFRYPMKLETLILGGMLTSMCTWSGIR